jgi:hypothetical protein
VPEQKAAKPNLQLALFSPLEPYLPTRQAPGEEYLLILPTKLAVFVHQAGTRATQRLNARAKSDRTYHLLISLRTGEKITRTIFTLEATTRRPPRCLRLAQSAQIRAARLKCPNLVLSNRTILTLSYRHPNSPTSHSAGFAGTRPGDIDRLENKQPERVLTSQGLVSKPGCIRRRSRF